MWGMNERTREPVCSTGISRREHDLCAQCGAQLLLGQAPAQAGWAFPSCLASFHQLTLMSFSSYSELPQSYSLQSTPWAGEAQGRSYFNKHHQLLPQERQGWAGGCKTTAVTWDFQQENQQEERQMSSTRQSEERGSGPHAMLLL